MLVRKIETSQLIWDILYLSVDETAEDLLAQIDELISLYESSTQTAATINT